VVVISVVSIVLFWFVDLTRTLRVSADGELEGIDVHEHGTHAYHMEFGQGSSFTTFPSTRLPSSNGEGEQWSISSRPSSSPTASKK
jgi:hypothetical protein